MVMTETSHTATQNTQRVHLPLEILLIVIEHITSERAGYVDLQKSRQSDLHALCLVNRAWNEATTPYLYAAPVLQGRGYEPFTNTICPSINFRVRKSPLAHLVQRLDLSLLVHQGSKSVTARLLGRTKDNLRRFAAPQASFSVNCFPALVKCRKLAVLDLSLVSEAANLQTLFDTISHLPRLRVFHLPRSAGFGAKVDPGKIQWPPRLRELALSGGLDREFWRGQFSLPESLRHVLITHCPRLDRGLLYSFLDTLIQSHGRKLVKLTINHLPQLRAGQLDGLLLYFPCLLELSISVDYMSSSFGFLTGTGGRVLPELYDNEQTFEMIYDDVGYDSDASVSSMTTSRGAGGRGEGDTIAVTRPDLYHLMTKRLSAAQSHTIYPLLTLELTNSGHTNDRTVFDPLDLLTSVQGDDSDVSEGDDEAESANPPVMNKGILPCLSRVVVAASLGWTKTDDSQSITAALSHYLKLVGQELELDVEQCGVKVKNY